MDLVDDILKIEIEPLPLKQFQTRNIRHLKKMK